MTERSLRRAQLYREAIEAESLYRQEADRLRAQEADSCALIENLYREVQLLGEDRNGLRAENAELLARVKELERDLRMTQGSLGMVTVGSGALESALRLIANALPKEWAGDVARSALKGEAYHNPAIYPKEAP